MTRDRMEKREEGGDRREVGEQLQSQHFKTNPLHLIVKKKHVMESTEQIKRLF